MTTNLAGRSACPDQPVCIPPTHVSSLSRRGTAPVKASEDLPPGAICVVFGRFATVRAVVSGDRRRGTIGGDEVECSERSAVPFSDGSFVRCLCCRHLVAVRGRYRPGPVGARAVVT